MALDPKQALTVAAFYLLSRPEHLPPVVSGGVLMVAAHSYDPSIQTPPTDPWTISHTLHWAQVRYLPRNHFDKIMWFVALKVIMVWQVNVVYRTVMVINYSVCWVIGILFWICLFICLYEMKVKLTSAGWFPQTPAGVLWPSGSSCGSAQIWSRFTEDKSQCWDAVDCKYLWRSLMLQQHVHAGFSRIQPRGWEGYILYQICPKDF